MKYFLIVIVAFVISLAVTPFAIKIAPKINAMDVPKDARRMHTKAMPRFGGISMFLGTETALALFLHNDPKVLTILFGGACIYVIGVIDDIRGMGAKLKFILQILTAIVVYIGGIQIDFVKNPFDEEAYIFFPGGLSMHCLYGCAQRTV